MSLLMWNPICDSLLYYLLEKRCPALAKQFKDLFFPQHIDVTNNDLTHLVNYFSKPSKKRGLSSKVVDPEGKKIKLEETTDKHEESETPNSVATLQENETVKVTSAVLESSIDNSSDDDTPVIVTPVKKPAAPVVQLSSGSSSSGSSSDSDSDTEEETSSQNSSSKSHKNDQHSVNSQTPTSSSANSATNRCDFSARHTCQASPIPSTSSHDQGKALKASSVREHVGSTDPTLRSKKSSDNSKARKSNSSHKSDSFFDRLMGGNSFPQVTKSNNGSSDSHRDKTIPSSPYSGSSRKKVDKTVASPACVSNDNFNKSAKSKVPSVCNQSTPKTVVSPACSQSTQKTVNSPACSQSTPKTVISPACNQSTPKPVISPACSQSTPKPVISPACSQSTPKPVVSPACSQPTPKSVISPAYSQSTPRLCRYGMDCRRRLAGDCQFTHTSVRKQSEEPRVGPGGRRICRYGGDCRRMLYCNYEHVL